MKKAAVWIENDPAVHPNIQDIAGSDETVIRVFRRSQPFILGRLAAFFVGETAQADAELFVGMVEVFDSVKRGQL